MFAWLKKKKKAKLPARIRGNACLNCNVNLKGSENFCPDCGQRNNIKQLSFKLVIDEFFGDMFTYDSRVWRTLIPLIFKPGQVAYQFIQGRRKDFVNPFRTYLTISLIFFLIMGFLNTLSELRNDGRNTPQGDFGNFQFTPEKDSISKNKNDSIKKDALSKVKKNIDFDLDSTLRANKIDLDSIDIDNLSLDSLQTKATEQSAFYKKLSAFYEHYEENKEHSVAQALDSLGYENTFWNRFYFDKAKDTNDMFKDGGQTFRKRLISGMSITIFLLLPVFAWFLKLFYIRRKYTYMEHMVFVYYAQSVFFFLLLIFTLINFFIGDKEGVFLIPMLLFGVYLLLAMHNFYKQHWFKTFIKYILANITFMFVAGLGFILLTVVSFIFY